MAAKRKKSSAAKKTAQANTRKKVSERNQAKKSTSKKKTMLKKNIKKKTVSKKKTTTKKKGVSKKKTASKKIARKKGSVFITSIGGPIAVEWTSYDRVNSKEVINHEQIIKFDNLAVETKKHHVIQLVQLSEKLAQSADLGSLKEANIRDGIIYFEYNQENHQLWLWTQYTSTRKLIDNEIEFLVNFTNDNWNLDIIESYIHDLRDRYGGIAPVMMPKQIFLKQFENCDGRWPRFYSAPLFYAIKSGNIKKLNSWLKSGGDINLRDIHDDYTLLMVAVINDQEKMVSRLIESGADVNSVSAVNGETALSLSTSSSEKITKYLLDANANTDVRSKVIDHEGKTPLLWSIYFGQKRHTKILLEHGSQIDESDDNGDTVLHQIPLDSLDYVDILIEAGADVYRENGDGETPYLFTMNCIDNFTDKEEKSRCQDLANRLKRQM